MYLTGWSGNYEMRQIKTLKGLKGFALRHQSNDVRRPPARSRWAGNAASCDRRQIGPPRRCGPICRRLHERSTDDSCSTSGHALSPRMAAGVATRKQRRNLPPAEDRTASPRRSDLSPVAGSGVACPSRSGGQTAAMGLLRSRCRCGSADVEVNCTSSHALSPRMTAGV